MWDEQHELTADKIYVMCYDLGGFFLKKEFGRRMGEIFENFDVNPLDSPSIAHVHRARLRGDKNDVVVKVSPLEDDFKASYVYVILTIPVYGSITGRSSKPMTIAPNASYGGLLLRWGSFGPRELARFNVILEKPVRLKHDWLDNEDMLT
ncbi:hypothetical protein Goshw_029060 [Gossypium schwendimanii]|uniref:ABC1 atypical kinase-like domain-containing protein n=1 Tax=Gossypium schwendimanii TaxID=34291 RepID=A0A7J9L6Z0_GOSSC|nr:hypothetical protein [Gossypium schwendimanii]